MSDTNELEYSLTQSLYLKRLHSKPCSSGVLPPTANGSIYVPEAYKECGGDTSEWITWKLAAKIFFRSLVRAAASPFRRNVLASTLDFTGVSFLNGPRNDSPVISRLKVRTSEHTDFEWDADYDFKTKRLDASNIFTSYRQDNFFASVAYSTLQALNPTFSTHLANQVTKYNILRLLAGYGDPVRRGFSADADAGYDFVQDTLQYGGIQVAYNWSSVHRHHGKAGASLKETYHFSFNPPAGFEMTILFEHGIPRFQERSVEPQIPRLRSG